MSTNPALEDLQILLGSWRTDLYNAAFLHDAGARAEGSVVVDWTENGAAVVLRQGDSVNPPAAVWIVGRDEAQTKYQILYCDERGVSRVYQMRFGEGNWMMWRDHPGFAQRFEAVIDRVAQKISGRWEKSFDGGATWEHDFNFDYYRS